MHNAYSSAYFLPTSPWSRAAGTSTCLGLDHRFESISESTSGLWCLEQARSCTTSKKDWFWTFFFQIQRWLCLSFPSTCSIYSMLRPWLRSQSSAACWTSFESKKLPSASPLTSPECPAGEKASDGPGGDEQVHLGTCPLRAAWYDC